MKKEFIPYEQAVELKKLGFNEPCLFCYRGEYDLYCHSLGGYLADMLLKSNLDLDTYEINKTKQHWVSTPTYSQAFRWFREKYNQYHFIHYHSAPSYTFAVLNDIEIYWTLHEKISFKTYEEAELACLKKLIEIAKLKQN